MRLSGLVLIVFGVLALVYWGYTCTARETVLEVGPVQVTALRSRPVPFAPITGLVAVVAGLALVVASRARRA